jgi:hypothetical protein
MVVGGRGESFSNETTGLGASRGPSAWNLVQLAPTEEDRVAVLATDGVSDDLVPERLDGFFDWLVATFQGSSPAERWRALSAELRAWPTPGHLDDKTLAVLHAPAVAAEESP